MVSLSALLTAWSDFFHAPESCAPQVLFRILMGLLLTVNAVLLWPLVSDFYASDSVWNVQAWERRQRGLRFCLLHWLPQTTTSVRWLLGIHLLACIAFLAGLQFRVSALVVFLTLTSIHHRNAYVLSSGDTLLRLFSFLAIFSAAGESCSVDAWVQGREGFPVVDPWPLRLMQVLVAIVYVRTVLWKLRGQRWRDGTAAWYPVWVDTYLRRRPPEWLLRAPFIQVATWGTLLTEFALGTMIWIREFRVPVILTGIAMHLVFEMTLNLQLFGWTMITGLLLFVDPTGLENLFSGH